MNHYIIRVFDNDDHDTGIWHKGTDVIALILKAAQSTVDVYGIGVNILRTREMSGGFAGSDGTTYRYEIQETER